MVQDMNHVRKGSRRLLRPIAWAVLAVVTIFLAWIGVREEQPDITSDEDKSLIQETSEAEPKSLTGALATSSSLTLGQWKTYPEQEVDKEWLQEPLDARRWAQVSAELACAGRSNRGDPEAHRRFTRNIVAHHRTSLAEVSSFSTRINEGSAATALLWAAPISEAVKGCH